MVCSLAAGQDNDVRTEALRRRTPDPPRGMMRFATLALLAATVAATPGKLADQVVGHMQELNLRA